MNNYQDDKCYWGYITICLKCVKYIINNRQYKHIHINKKIIGFPLTEVCEICGNK